MSIEYRVRMTAEVVRIERDETGAMVEHTVTDVNEDIRYYSAAWAKSEAVRTTWRSESAERGRALGQRAVENVLSLVKLR